MSDDPRISNDSGGPEPSYGDSGNGGEAYTGADNGEFTEPRETAPRTTADSGEGEETGTPPTEDTASPSILELAPWGLYPLAVPTSPAARYVSSTAAILSPL